MKNDYLIKMIEGRRLKKDMRSREKQRREIEDIHIQSKNVKKLKLREK
jgi:hypothetical protein